MKSLQKVVVLATILVLTVVLIRVMSAEEQESGDEAQVKRGLEIAPVRLDLRGKNRALVGKGSYLVNAVSECNDCHTRPHFVTGGNPFIPGQVELDTSTQHLTGGNQFGPFTSRNLTPDAMGRPAGMTFDQFLHTMRTGETDDHPQFGPLLQVMPWPTFRKMTDHDLRAIYEYLRAIPSRPDNPSPGECCPDTLP